MVLRNALLRRLLFRCTTVCLSLLGFAIFMEAAVRLFVPRALYGFRDRSTDWQLHPRLGWVQKPNLDVTTQEDGDFVVRFQTNCDGLAPPTARREKEAAVTRLMVFGDSTVVGRAIPQDQTIHAHLERILKNQRLTAEVINAGVEGYSTDQELLRMEELLPLYRPNIVLLAVCSNDFAANEMSVSSGLNKPRFQLARNGSLTEIPPESNHDLSTFRSWPNQWLHHSAAYRFLSPRVRVLRAKFGNWRERNLLGLPLDLYYRPAADPIDWQLFRALLVRIKESCLKAGAQFLFYAHPALEEVWDPSVHEMISVLGVKPEQYDRYALEKRLHSVAREVGVDHCPLIEYFAKRQERGPFHLLPREGHCNPVGYELTAEVLAAHLTTYGYFPSERN
jgi:hypothetical protein